MPQLTNPPGQTAAQVQALIDASLAAHGVIGTAVLTVVADSITITHADGVLTGGGAGFVISGGDLEVTFTANQPDAFYNVSLAIDAGGAITAGWDYPESTLAVGSFHVRLFDTKTAAVLNPFDGVIRVTVVRK